MYISPTATNTVKPNTTELEIEDKETSRHSAFDFGYLRAVGLDHLLILTAIQNNLPQDFIHFCHKSSVQGLL
jgi:hypothetical protein